MQETDRWWERVAHGSVRGALRHPQEFWDRQWLRHLSAEDRERLTRAQVVATRPAFTAVLAGGALLLGAAALLHWMGLTPGIGYPVWLELAVAASVVLLAWANWRLQRWYVRLVVMLVAMALLGVFLSIPMPDARAWLPIRTGLFHLIPIALLALTVRPVSTLFLVLELVALTVVRVTLHGAPPSGAAMYWLYTLATLVFGLMLSMYRTDFAVEAYRTRLMLWKQASTDALTGLANRAGWEHSAKRLHDAAGSRAATRALVFLDVDHFKHVNDTWGHERGDGVLRALGQVLATRLGPDAYAARLGGEEFAVLMIDVTPAAVERFAERVRRDFAKATREFGCTVSAGIAFADPGEDLAAHLRRADAALYAAKAAGRDRIIVAASPRGTAS